MRPRKTTPALGKAWWGSTSRLDCPIFRCGSLFGKVVGRFYFLLLRTPQQRRGGNNEKQTLNAYILWKRPVYGELSGVCHKNDALILRDLSLYSTFEILCFDCLKFSLMCSLNSKSDVKRADFSRQLNRKFEHINSGKRGRKNSFLQLPFHPIT